MSSWFGRKKRKIDDQGGTVSGGGGGESTAAVNEEATLRKTMTEIMNQNRDMLQIMQNMQGEMMSMKHDIKSIQSKQVRVESSLGLSTRDVKKKQNSNHMMLLGMDERQKYHEVLLKNQKWEYSAPRPSQEYWNGLDPVEDGEAEKFLESIKKYTKDMRHGIICNPSRNFPFPNISIFSYDSFNSCMI